MSSRQPEPCDATRGQHAGAVRFYTNGWKCDRHSPWAAKGQPEPQPGPGMPAAAWVTASPISDSRVHDARAIASGKRRSNPQAVKAARAAVDHRKDT